MGVLLGSGVLALWIDVAPEVDRETDGWYIDEHLPERIDIGGHLRARRMAVLEGSPAYLTTFEAQDPASLASEGYLRLVKTISEQSRRLRTCFSNIARNTFKVRQSCGRGTGTVFGTLRLKPVRVPPAEAARNLDELVPTLLRRHAIVGVHWLEAAPEVRAKMDKVRAVGQSDSLVDYVLIIEATRADDIGALRLDTLSNSGLEKIGWSLDAFGIYTLMYEVSSFTEGKETILGNRAE